MIPELASIANVSPKADPKEVAAKVQGMFVEIMLKAMEEMALSGEPRGDQP